VPLAVAKALLSLASAIGLVVCLRLVFRQLGDEGRSYGAAALPVALAVAIWLEPVRATIDFGQINLLLMVLILVDILGIRDQRRSGFLIGLAAAVKLTPLAFIPYLFLVRRRRAAANAVAGFVGATVIGFACYPGPSVAYWRHHLFLNAHRVGHVEDASNQSVRGILARGLGTAQVPVWWIVLAAAVFAAGTAVAVMLYRRRSLVWSVTAMSITILCVSPISWSHHWAWCAVMLPVCWDLASRRRGWRQAAMAGIVMVPFAAGLTFWGPHLNHRELSDSLFQQFLSSSYVLAGILLVALLAATALSGGARPSRTPSS
jgi:alpha-1,2-mannosyltransferase